MEENLAITNQYQQFLSPSFDTNVELLEFPRVNKALNQYRHQSLIYGLEFQSKVSLYVRHQSQNTTLVNLENIPKQELYKKVLQFLNLAVTNSSMFQKFIKPFKILDEQMQLSVKKTSRSVYSNSGQIDLSSGSDCSSSKKVKEALLQLTNSPSPHSIGGQAIKKLRTSMMSKSNRISIAQAININELQKLSKIEAIQSAQSLQLIQSSLKKFKSKRRLSSEPPSDNQSDCKSIREIKINFKKKASKRKNKISILLMDELSLSSQLFSEGQTTLSLSQIALPQLKIDELMLEVFFDPYQLYLVNLSLCLFCKCLSRGLVNLKEDTVGWLLGVSTIVAYKLYYDQTIEGLIQWFCEGMGMSLPQLLKLQRWFLGSLNYEAAVSTQQYQNILMRIMTIS